MKNVHLLSAFQWACGDVAPLGWRDMNRFGCVLQNVFLHSALVADRKLVGEHGVADANHFYSVRSCC